MHRVSAVCAVLLGCAATERAVPPPAAVEVVERRPEQTLVLTVEASHALPDGAPAVVAHVAEGQRGGPASAVIYLHGWEGCAAMVVATDAGPCTPGEPVQPGWGIGALHGPAGVDVLVVPQLAYMARSSAAGRFDDPEFARSWWSEVREQLQRDAGVELGQVTVAAHSGGYRTLQAMLEADLDGVGSAVLLDALYGGSDRVAAWATGAPGRRVVSVHTANRDTTGQSRDLADRVRDALGEQTVGVDPVDLGEAVRTRTAVIVRTDVGHGEVPRVFLGSILEGLRGG